MPECQLIGTGRRYKKIDSAAMVITAESLIRLLTPVLSCGYTPFFSRC